MNKIIALVIGTAVAVGGGSFYGGMKYQASKMQSRLGAGNFQNMRDLSTGRQVLANRAGANMSGGEIISKDDKSITIKLRDGGSKIVFY